MKADIIGDVHGCYEEMMELFETLGYEMKNGIPVHPNGRVPIFVGDLQDRGPNSVAVMRLVYQLVIEQKKGYYVPGNHCNKLYRYFLGNNVKLQHGLETTVAELQALDDATAKRVKEEFMTLYDESPLYLIQPELNVVVAHAGIREDMIGSYHKKVRTFVLYGDITGEFHPNGMPVRRDWAQHYNGERWIVYGHTPVREPRFKHKTVNIDTGCVFGGKLTAFRLPEETIVSVPSRQEEVTEKFRTFDD
ncbi:metallophosphatase [Pontibacillus halophilus JSM 076056 = DSM 19796]|uniref:Metallophosphatase n=1 Tax=Pontibacillus halophilus JSM 076056 = DSM 19796 TaxID=1385510 RepID=A0A0A5GN77_9BACI|nr:bis(5'-nucleosyl)-tetraphosphatase PrpE [Pontibacillus halophilus]KGX92708.1 metallophosphatase [Pontibacillus halophilus JSM 076056 = DSM 19796]